MDHEQRTKVSEQLNPEWAARVVRNIGTIEADFFHASWFLSERMMSEVSIGVQTGPLIGAQKGPPVRMAER